MVSPFYPVLSFSSLPIQVELNVISIFRNDQKYICRKECLLPTGHCKVSVIFILLLFILPVNIVDLILTCSGFSLDYLHMGERSAGG